MECVVPRDDRAVSGDTEPKDIDRAPEHPGTGRSGLGQESMGI